MRLPRPERHAATVAALLATLALAGAPTAGADVGGQIIAICVKDQLPTGFSQAAYSKALKELSATAEEYSDCGQLIRQAQRAGASGHPGGNPAAGGSAPAAQIAATPTEQRAIARAAKSGGAPVSLGEGQVVHPGVVHADIASALSTLPAPLLAVLALMLAGLLGVAGAALRKRARGGRAD
jgi:hypothetical protein